MGMKRPSKKEIREAVQRLKDPKSGGPVGPDLSVPKLETKKPTKNRIRKKGI